MNGRKVIFLKEPNDQVASLHIQPKEKIGEGIKCGETITNKRKILSKIVG